ncbi:MAG TPA: lipocalin family protein [Enhygromyxa sp.]|nr:lipocalin family protein [Enhygromyxa sp.]
MQTCKSSPREPLTTPSADGVQPEHRSQWWYWSGQLSTRAGRRFGFQVAFFAAEAIRGLLWGQMAHWALVDLDGGRFASDSRVWLGAPRRIEGRFALASPAGATEVSAFGGDGLDRLQLRLAELSLDLRAHGGPVVPHYQGQAHDYAFGGYSFYYSRPRMRASGQLGRGSVSESVDGEVWFDRQFGELSCALIEGWQWLSIHLDGGEQIMLFSFNRELDERLASITDAAGQTRWLRPAEVRLEVLERWRSPSSRVEYPCAWRLQTDAHELEIRTPVLDQEMRGHGWIGPVYWEGACEVSGSHRGRAYVELLGSLDAALGRAVRPDRQDRLARALRHPTVALGLATAVGRVSRLLAAARPSFPVRDRDGSGLSGALTALHPVWRRARAADDRRFDRAPTRRAAGQR